MKKSLLFFLFFLMTNCCYCFAKEKPDLIIISPQKEAKIFGDKVIFSFFTSNFILGIDGYLKVSLDQKEPLTVREQRDLPLTNLSPGKHNLVARLVDKNGRPLIPGVKKEVSFKTVLPKEEKKSPLAISPSQKKETKILFPLSLGLLGFAGALFLFLALKFYINSKAGQNRPNQKPLG